MNFFSHRRMVKYRESTIFADVFCLLTTLFVDGFGFEHDLDAL